MSRVSSEAICMMCHLSSECSGCCRVCKKKQCNGGRQLCLINDKGQLARLESWKYIVVTTDRYAEMYKTFCGKNKDPFNILKILEEKQLMIFF